LPKDNIFGEWGIIGEFNLYYLKQIKLYESPTCYQAGENSLQVHLESSKPIGELGI